MKWPLLCLISLFPLMPTPALAATPIATFSKADLENWKEESFSGNTKYFLTTDTQTMVLEAQSKASASIYYKKIKVDLNKTPVLNWSWKLIQPLSNDKNEQEKEGDDFSARIYVVYKYGILPWSAVALNYVWSSKLPIGADWGNPYSSKDHMIVMQSGVEKKQQWQQEKRNIKTDFSKYFDRDVDTITGVAIMVDTDDTQGMAGSRYGDIYFTEE